MDCVLCRTGLGRTRRIAVYDKTARRCHSCKMDFDRSLVEDDCPICGKPLRFKVDHYARVCTNCGGVIEQ